MIIKPPVVSKAYTFNFNLFDASGELSPLAKEIIRQGLANFKEDSYDDHHRSAVQIPDDAKWVYNHNHVTVTW